MPPVSILDGTVGTGEAPSRIELGAYIGIEDVLEAGHAVWYGAHVASTLHVVLPAQRRQARTPAANVAGEQRQVDERQHVVDAVVMLCDPEGPTDLCLVGGGVRVGEFTD